MPSETSIIPAREVKVGDAIAAGMTDDVFYDVMAVEIRFRLAGGFDALFKPDIPVKVARDVE